MYLFKSEICNIIKNKLIKVKGIQCPLKFCQKCHVIYKICDDKTERGSVV